MISKPFKSDSVLINPSANVPPTEGTWNAGTILIDATNKDVWICTQTGIPGTWEKLYRGDVPSSDIIEKGIISVNDSDSAQITFQQSYQGQYIPYAIISENLNVWITDINNNGFVVNFSARYTGYVYYFAVKV